MDKQRMNLLYQEAIFDGVRRMGEKLIINQLLVRL